MRKLYESLGSAEYDNLIYDLFPPAVPFTVTIRKEASAKAVLKRGTVLALSGGTAGDGKMVILGTAAVENETLTANCILADDTEVGTDADVVATAYRTGHFNSEKLIVAEEHTLSAEEKETLRNAGILISEALEP